MAVPRRDRRPSPPPPPAVPTPTSVPIIRLPGPPPPPSSLRMLVWDVTTSRAPERLQPIAGIDGSHVVPVDGGTRLLLTDDTGSLAVLDIKDCRAILTSPLASRWRPLRLDPALPHLTILALPAAGSRGAPIACMLYSLTDGSLLDTYAFAAARADVSWSPDAAVRVVRTWTTGSAGMVSLFDRASGRFLQTKLAARLAQPVFFPGSGKYLDDSLGPGSLQIPIYDTQHAQPLALLDVAPGPRFSDDGIVVSPDGRSILIRKRNASGDTYHLYRPTGWDCPESRFGLLAFPHVWLLIVLLTGVTLSLLRDARQSAAHLPSPPAQPLLLRLLPWPLVA